MGNTRKHWTRDEVELVLALRGKNVPVSTIAARMQRTKASIYCIVSRARAGQLSQKSAIDPDVDLSLLMPKKKKNFMARLINWLFG